MSRIDRALLLAPAMALTIALAVLPLGLVAAYSLMPAAAFGGVEPGWTPAAYVALLFQPDIFSGELAFAPDHLLIAARSLTLATISTAICLVIGFPMAWFMATRPQGQQPLWVLAITIPFWSSLLVRALALVVLFGDAGLVNVALLATGLRAEPLPILYTDLAVLLGLVYSLLPFMVLPIYSALQRLDPRLVEAAADLHAGRWTILLRVLVPLAWPGIVAGSVLVFVPALGSYVIPLVLGGGRSMLLGDLIALQFGSGRNWPLGAALSVVLTLAVAAAYLVLQRREKRP
jgi:spermidine/putrescine transport system permease protein